jgi:septal ring factor EnvC (AmiA/AmiB activator)
MLSLFYRLALWLVQKIGVAVLIVVFGLGAYAFWLFARDHSDFDVHRLELLQRFTGEQQHLQTALGEVRQRIANLETDLGAQQERLRTADRMIAALRADDTWWRTMWGKLFGDSAEVRTKEERLARLEEMQADATARSAELRTAVTRAIWERDGVEIALGRVDRHLAAVERDRSKTRHYLALAWQRSRWYVIAALVLWFLGPALWRRRRRPG